MRLLHTQTTTAPPERIWALWTDVDRWPLWDIDLKSSVLDGPFEAGTTGFLEPMRGPGARFEIDWVEHGVGYQFTTKLPLCRIIVRRELNAQQGTTRFTHCVEFTGPLSPIFGRVLGRQLRRRLPEAMQNLRHLAEGKSLAFEQELSRPTPPQPQPA